MASISDLSKLRPAKYTGPKDSRGKVHGYGEMIYAEKGQPDQLYSYSGTFHHGVRRGFGVWAVRRRSRNSVEKWQYYQQGDYDAAGRLIAPAHESGSYEEYTYSWIATYIGWWRDDKPFEPTPIGDGLLSFEITSDNAFLERFCDNKSIQRLSEDMVESLKNSTDPYGRYGYGRWLCRTQKCNREALKVATECFKFAAENGVADALQALSHLYDYGLAYDAERDALVWNGALAEQLSLEAWERGSLLAKLRRNSGLYYGSYAIRTDKSAAIAQAEAEASKEGASPLWLGLLGWYYESEDRIDDAIDAYLSAIEAGRIEAICDLACCYLNKGETEYYESLMKEGIRLGVADCMFLGCEYRASWDDLDDYTQRTIHNQLRENLERGAMLGNGNCAYYLAHFLLEGRMGFEWELERGAKMALRAANLGCAYGFVLLADILSDKEMVALLPKDLQELEQQWLVFQLNALRLGADELLEAVVIYADEYRELGYGEELDAVWLPKWRAENKN